MNQHERDALRKKHTHVDVTTDDCGYVLETVECDVIKLLNAWESSLQEE
jgi:hypothetical protein